MHRWVGYKWTVIFPLVVSINLCPGETSGTLFPYWYLFVSRLARRVKWLSSKLNTIWIPNAMQEHRNPTGYLFVYVVARQTKSLKYHAISRNRALRDHSSKMEISLFILLCEKGGLLSCQLHGWNISTLARKLSLRSREAIDNGSKHAAWSVIWMKPCHALRYFTI